MTAMATTFNSLDFDRCYKALEARDARFDGWFITGVTSTGIYCRPSCPTPVQPMRKNVRFFPTAAAAQLTGLRACKRCLPDASPGSPEWDSRADLTGRAMRLISDGVVDREGVSGLARHLAVSERNLNRILQREVGASPVALARAQRARAARILIETTEIPFTTVAFAAGFGSIRQFNDTVREVFARTPTELRAKRSRRVRETNQLQAGAINLRLAFRAPMLSRGLASWIAGHAPAATTRVDDLQITRSLSLPHGHGLMVLHLPDGAEDESFVHCSLQLEDFADLGAAVSRARRLLDLDADPHTIVDHFAGTPLAALATEHCGLRVPGAIDGFEQAVMTILGQQVTVAAGRTFANRLVAECGDRLNIDSIDGATDDDRANNVDRGSGHPTHVFPSPANLATADLSTIGLTTRRQKTLRSLAEAVIESSLDLSPGANRDATREALLALPGIGPWTAEIVAMRALGDPDVFPAGDLVLQKAAARLGLPDTESSLAETAGAWAPWRSYAAHLLWTAGTTAATSTKKKKKKDS